jgi:uncharacterized protein (DUF2141 family)
MKQIATTLFGFLVRVRLAVLAAVVFLVNQAPAQADIISGLTAEVVGMKADIGTIQGIAITIGVIMLAASLLWSAFKRITH